jgi:hypothetical protein
VWEKRWSNKAESVGMADAERGDVKSDLEGDVAKKRVAEEAKEEANEAFKSKARHRHSSLFSIYLLLKYYFYLSALHCKYCNPGQSTNRALV